MKQHMTREHFRQFVQRMGRAPFVVFLGSALLGWLLPVAGLFILTAALASLLKQGYTFFEKLLLSFLLVLTGTIGLYTLTTILHFGPPIGAVGGIYAIVGVALWYCYGWRHKGAWISKRDIACLLLAVVLGAISLFPIAYTRKSGTMGVAEATLHLLYSGEDNASHYGMFTYAYHHDRLSYGSDAQQSGLIPGLTNYPQGSEFLLAWITKGTIGERFTDHHRLLILAYHFLTVAFFCLLLAMMALLAARIYEQVKGRFSLLSGSVLIAIVGSIGFCGPLLQAFSRGFHSQLFAYLLLLALIYVMVLYRSEPRSKTAFVLACIFFAGISASWWFLTPVGAVLLAWMAWERRKLWRAYLPVVALVAPIILLGVYPILLGLFSSSKAGVVNAAGGVDVIATVTLFLYGLGISLWFVLPKAARSVLLPVMLAIGGGILFAAAIGIYQQLTLGAFAYFYFKSLYTLVPLAVVVIAVAGLYAAGLLSTVLGRWQRVYMSVGIIVLTVAVLAYAIKPVFPAVYLHDWFDNRSTPADLTMIFDQVSTGKYEEVVMAGGCHNGTTYMTNRWNGAFMLSESQWHGDIDNATLYGNQSWLMELLDQAPYAKEKIFVYAPANCASQELVDFIKQRGFATNL